jgi:hypothetical protein
MIIAEFPKPYNALPWLGQAVDELYFAAPQLWIRC